MGECRSGFQGFKRDIVEDCLILSITDLFREKLLVDGSLSRGEWRWRRGDRYQADAALRIDADLLDQLHATIRLRYFAHGELIDTWIWLTTTSPRFGGRRWWFKCPITNRRVANLYLPPGERRFGGREAYGLSYRSSQNNGANGSRRRHVVATSELPAR
jgi:hypothetical protein